MNARRWAARMAAEAEAIPDPWAMVAEAMRVELDRLERERQADPLYGLSRDALVVLWALYQRGGSATDEGGEGPSDEALAVLEELEVDILAGINELTGRGLVQLTWVIGSDWPPLPHAIARPGLEVPPLEEILRREG